jgi:Holliday junction resolvase RusA-like endonuclease
VSDAAWFGLRREALDLPVVARFTVDGEPMSKARARFSKTGRAYTPESTRAAEERVGWAFRQAAGSYSPSPDHTFGVVALFFHATAQRRDVDNMLKLVCDALNKLAWVDDDQVTEVSARKLFTEDPGHARTEVLVYRSGHVLSQMLWMPCAACGVPVRTFRSWRGKTRYCSRACSATRLVPDRECQHCSSAFRGPARSKFCSKECQQLATTVEVQCTECSQVFRIAPSVLAQRTTPLCSNACRQAFWRRRRAVRASGVCQDCGGPTSKKMYRRCRACNMKVRGAS